MRDGSEVTAPRVAGAIASLTILLFACGGPPLQATKPARENRYPAFFVSGSFEPYGIGMSPIYRDRARSDSVATAMALRGLSWARHVRVRGEKLFQVRGVGDLHFRGQDVELLDAAPVRAQSTRLDTCVLDDRVWVVAQGPGPLCAQTQMFPETKPGWFEELPKKNGWTFAHGVSALSYKDEAGSWEVATYRALVELAVDRSARLGSLERSTTGAVEGAMRVQVDAELVGARIVGRWRDQRNVHVLAASQVAR